MFKKFFKWFESENIVQVNDAARDRDIRYRAFMQHVEGANGSSLAFLFDQVEDIDFFLTRAVSSILAQYNTHVTIDTFGLPVKFLHRVLARQDADVLYAVGCDDDAHTLMFYIDLLDKASNVVENECERFLIKQLASDLARAVDREIYYEDELIWSSASVDYQRLLHIVTL